MNKSEYHQYLSSPAWKAISFKVKENAGNRCQVCNSPDNLQAHHRTYANIGNESEHLGDLVCLCGGCHQLFHQERHLYRSRKGKKGNRGKNEKDLTPVPDGYVLMTKELLKDLAFINSQWNSSVISALGIARRSGWTKRHLGKTFPENLIKKARQVANEVFNSSSKPPWVPMSYMNDDLDDPQG